jgi:hypothetical protein
MDRPAWHNLFHFHVVPGHAYEGTSPIRLGSGWPSTTRWAGIFVARKIANLRFLNITLFNRANNIVNLNTDVAQLKVLIDSFLRRLLEEKREIDHYTF